MANASSGKFTIVTVNYKTWYLIKYQLKIYYEFNDSKDFHFIIIDNSVSEEEKENLEKVVDEYRKFGNIEVMYNKPYLTENDKKKLSFGSGQHGQGLEIGLQRAYEIYDGNFNFKYCIMQDPDWFWSISNHLNYLRNEIEQANLCAIGGAYNFIEQNLILRHNDSGNFNFPALFGCVFDLTKFERTVSLMPGHLPHGQDVGWQKRKYMSDKGFNYFGFLQNDKSDLRKAIGETNTENLMSEYCKSFYDRKIIAYHLLRGSQVNEEFMKNFVLNFSNGNHKESLTWKDNKLAFAVFIYESILNNKSRFMGIGKAAIAMAFKVRIILLLYGMLDLYKKKAFKLLSIIKHIIIK